MYILFQHLYSFLAGDSGPPVWPALTYLTADCNYGGRVSDNDNADDYNDNDDNDDTGDWCQWQEADEVPPPEGLQWSGGQHAGMQPLRMR